MSLTISILLDITQILVLVIAILLGIAVIGIGIYQLIKWIIHEKNNISNWRQYYEKEYDKKITKVEKYYDNELKLKFEEYFRKFYNEEMTKKKG